MRYAPTHDSIRSHRVPDWFHDAKLGIFIHWGLYSIPGWAPTSGPLPEVIAQKGWRYWFAHNPYAEWYNNSIHIPESPSAAYHAATYGPDFPYEQFAPMFDAAVQDWDPPSWADLFAAAGARYVVLTTKHHDGFLLWPSTTPHPFKAGYHTRRDLVGDLTAAVRERGLRMGLYYSGGIDYTFDDLIVRDISDLYRALPRSPAYAAYADGQVRELIARYAPSVLWNDIAWPPGSDLLSLFADYYNALPDGVVNDRFVQPTDGALPEDSTDIFDEALAPNRPHFDFRTPEYAVFDTIRPEKWESTRGLGYSFGYNRNETPQAMLSPTELIHMVIDVVSKNGNLLLNVGPTGEGVIPDLQRERLLALGRWLAVNGEAIYATRPWVRAEGITADGIPLRFTRRDDALYATLLGTPTRGQLTIAGLAPAPGATVQWLGHDAPGAWSSDGANLVVTCPATLPDFPAHTLKIAPLSGIGGQGPGVSGGSGGG